MHIYVHMAKWDWTLQAIFSPFKSFISIIVNEKIKQIYGSSLTIFGAYDEILKYFQKYNDIN